MTHTPGEIWKVAFQDKGKGVTAERCVLSIFRGQTATRYFQNKHFLRSVCPPPAVKIIGIHPSGRVVLIVARSTVEIFGFAQRRDRFSALIFSASDRVRVCRGANSWTLLFSERSRGQIFHKASTPRSALAIFPLWKTRSKTIALLC